MTESSIAQNSHSQKQSYRLQLFVVAIALLMTVWSLGSYLWDEYRVVRDTQNFYWMARAQDPGLFPVDRIYLTKESINLEVEVFGFYVMFFPLSLGYGLIFFLSSALIDYVWVTKISALVLVAVSTIYLFKLGRFLQDVVTGLSLSLIFIFFTLASPLSTTIVSGLQRAFAIPLIIVFLYYLIKRQYIIANLIIFITTLIYLPSFPPIVLTYGLLLIHPKLLSKWPPQIDNRRVIPFIVIILVSGVIVLFAVAAQQGWLASSAETTSAEDTTEQVDVTDDPYFQNEGATPLFISFPFLGRAGIFDTGGDVANFLVMLIFAFLIYKVVGPNSWRRMPKELWALFAAGIIMYAVSLFFVLELSSFALYLPSRYTRSTMFLMMLFFVGLNWGDLLKSLPGWFGRNIRLFIFFIVTFSLAMGLAYFFSPDRRLLIPTFWFVGLIFGGIIALLGGSVLLWLLIMQPPMKPLVKWGSVIIIALAVIYLGTVYIGVLGVKTTNPTKDERKIYEFVETLPKDAVLAGDPDIMTNIPLFSKRSVLFRELFPGTDAPFVEYFDAQYAETSRPILDFCQNYDVSYLVFNTDEFSPGYLARGDFFYQPWNDIIAEKVTDRSNFVLLQLEPTFTSGTYTVIKCDAKTLLAKS